MVKFIELYWVVQKMAQLLISHKIHSGLCSFVKLQGRQFQPVFSQRINFQLNLKKEYGKARCLKKGCLKIEYCALINAK